jgi:hypothetical protein
MKKNNHRKEILKDHIVIGLMITIVTLGCNIGLEWWKGKQSKELSQQERIWNLKMPVYMALAKEFEGLFVPEGNEVDIDAKVRSFNTIYNKLFIVGDDNLVKQLNQTDNTDTVEYIKKAVVLMRKELNPDTRLSTEDYTRKKLKR